MTNLFLLENYFKGVEKIGSIEELLKGKEIVKSKGFYVDKEEIDEILSTYRSKRDISQIYRKAYTLLFGNDIKLGLVLAEELYLASKKMEFMDKYDPKIPLLLSQAFLVMSRSTGANFGSEGYLWNSLNPYFFSAIHYGYEAYLFTFSIWDMPLEFYGGRSPRREKQSNILSYLASVFKGPLWTFERRTKRELDPEIDHPILVELKKALDDVEAILSNLK